MIREIKHPWKYFPFSADQFKRWRLGYFLPTGQRIPPRFEGVEWRRAGHKTILYDVEALGGLHQIDYQFS
jgi:hypothetical protein